MAANLQACIHGWGRGSRIGVRMDRKEVSDDKATVPGCNSPSTHRALQETKDSRQMCFWPEVGGGGLLSVTLRDWQMAPPAAVGLAPGHLHTLRAVG